MSLLLDYAGVEMNAPGRIRTDTERGLGPLPLRWATGAKVVPAAGLAPALDEV